MTSKRSGTFAERDPTLRRKASASFSFQFSGGQLSEHFFHIAHLVNLNKFECFLPLRFGSEKKEGKTICNGNIQKRCEAIVVGAELDFVSRLALHRRPLALHNPFVIDIDDYSDFAIAPFQLLSLFSQVLRLEFHLHLTFTEVAAGTINIHTELRQLQFNVIKCSLGSELIEMAALLLFILLFRFTAVFRSRESLLFFSWLKLDSPRFVQLFLSFWEFSFSVFTFLFFIYKNFCLFFFFLPFSLFRLFQISFSLRTQHFHFLLLLLSRDLFFRG